MVLISVFDLDLDIVFYRREANTRKKILRDLALDLITVGQVLFVNLRTLTVLISGFDLDLDIVFYREEPNTGKEGKQSTHVIDAMLKQG